VVVGLALLFLSSYGPDVDLVHLGPDLADLYELLRIGTPSSIEDASTSLAILTVALFVASFPPAVVVAYGVGTRVLSFVQMVGGAFGQTTNTTVGQNLGAGQPERTRRAIRLAGVGVSGVMVALAVLVAVFAEPISRLFLVDSSAQTAMAVDHSVTYLRVLAVGFVFSGIFETVLGAYRGAGSTRTALGFSLVALWVGRVLVVVVLTAYVGMDAMGIWVGMITSSVVGSIVASLWMARGTWMDAVIEERSVA
jgi:Na+-driven multidrug efflux pump